MIGDRSGEPGVCSLIGFSLLAFAALGLFAIVAAYQESKTYNRLTGAETTTWDALWVELRVQDQPQMYEVTKDL